MTNAEFRLLLEKYKAGSLQPKEKARFRSLLASGLYDDELAGQIDKDFMRDDQVLSGDPELGALVLQQVLLGMEAEDTEKRSAPVHALRPWRRWIAAAAVVLTFGLATFFWMNRQKETPTAGQAIEQHRNNDIAPGGNKAVLTLADGRQIILDSAAKGVLGQQAGAEVTLTAEGTLIYDADQATRSYYNTIATPRGGQYQLMLGDGTKVWLNAASSLHFPTAFTGQERVVELRGEAYFEVAANKSMPFKVKAEGTVVEVLGTHFNINSYRDEPALKTTLLEGRVKVSLDAAGRGSQIAQVLAPGEQAEIRAGTMKLNKGVAIDEVMAWKEGRFQFENTDLPALLRQLERWYNIEVQYEGALPQRRFSGSISRQVPLSSVLKILAANNVQFESEGNKLTIQP